MKFVIAVLLTALLSFTAGIYLPWWSIAITSFIVAVVVQQKPGLAWLAGFAGLFLLWGLLALWIDVQNAGNLSHKIALILPLKGSALLLILITGLVGGLVAGFAALTGSYIRKR